MVDERRKLSYYVIKMASKREGEMGVERGGCGQLKFQNEVKSKR